MSPALLTVSNCSRCNLDLQLAGVGESAPCRDPCLCAPRNACWVGQIRELSLPVNRVFTPVMGSQETPAFIEGSGKRTPPLLLDM